MSRYRIREGGYMTPKGAHGRNYDSTGNTLSEFGMKLRHESVAMAHRNESWKQQEEVENQHHVDLNGALKRKESIDWETSLDEVYIDEINKYGIIKLMGII